jgi:hypothetical protein
MIKNCLFCKKEFESVPSKNRKYCSFICSVKNKKGKMPFVMTNEIREKISKTKKKNPTRYWVGKKKPFMSGKNHFLYGKKMSKEWRENLSKSHLGHIPSNKGIKRPEISNENHFAWKGDKVGYFALHSWVRRKLGKAQKCEFCGKEKTTPKNVQWANKSGKYFRDLTDWIQLCVKCHKEYDARVNP